MKILTDVRLLARGGVSGIEEYTRNLLSALLAMDEENEHSFFYNGFRKHPLSSQLPLANSKVIDWHLPNRIFDFSTRFLSWPKVGKISGADLIFSPHFNFLEKGDTPRVITFHDLSFLHHPYFFSWKQRAWHWLQNCRLQARRAEKIIAVSEFTRSDLVNTLGVPAEKIEIIYSGISEDFKIIDRFQPLIAEPFILYLGTIEPRKNIIALIRAFNLVKADSNFKNFKLILAGRKGWLYDNILREAHRSPYRTDIVFWGSVSHEEKIQLYNAAKVFVYPSFFEGFGFPPLEAQACGCPVIVADRTSLPEILGQSAIFLDPWRIGDLAGAIKKSVSDSVLRRSLISAGLKNAKRFSWKDTAAKTLRLFNSFKDK